MTDALQTAERQISFNASMVDAILSGLKTQTRRPVELSEGQAIAPCPYGDWGDRLLVKGTGIRLEISNVRTEQLKEISRGDAMAEGCPFPNMADGVDPRKWYAALWDQIYGHGSCEKNPWVWVIEFRRLND